MKNGQTEFWGTPLPPQKNIWGGVQKFVIKNEKKSKLFKNAWNGEKIGQKKVSDFLAPSPPKKII